MKKSKSQTEISMKNCKKAKSKRGAMYLSTFFSFCFLAAGFSRYEDIKTKGYYIEYKYQQVINGSGGMITVYALFFFGICLLLYSVFLLNREDKEI
jgi:hypothetical protein